MANIPFLHHSNIHEAKAFIKMEADFLSFRDSKTDFRNIFHINSKS